MAFKEKLKLKNVVQRQLHEPNPTAFPAAMAAARKIILIVGGCPESNYSYSFISGVSRLGLFALEAKIVFDWKIENSFFICFFVRVASPADFIVVDLGGGMFNFFSSCFLS